MAVRAMLDAVLNFSIFVLSFAAIFLFRSDQHNFEKTLYGVGALASDLVDEYDYRQETDTVDLNGSATMIPGSSVWGRPAIAIGTHAQNPSAWPAEDLVRLHSETTQFLAQTVMPFAKLAGA